MTAWLALLLVLCFTSLALTMTVRAWQVRRSAPGNLSLGLSAGACLAIVVSAADVPLTLPGWICDTKLEVGGRELGAAIEEALEQWHWWVNPCGRLVVEPGPADLARPIEFAKLAALAADSGIAVDVVLPGRSVQGGAELMLALVSEASGGESPRLLPINTPIPPSMSARVRPALRGRANELLHCAIDRLGPAKKTETLDSLLESGARTYQAQGGGGSDGFHRGFHHLECEVPGSGPASTVVAHVRVVPDNVVVASSRALRPEELLSAMEHAPRRAASFGLRSIVARPEQGSFAGVSMLVLDRPELAASCDQARALLKQGATVVVAHPGRAFADACKELLPAEPLLRGSEWAVFDRRPRVSFLFDANFTEGLVYPPTLVFGEPFDPADKGGGKTRYGIKEQEQEQSAKDVCVMMKDAGLLAGEPDCEHMGVWSERDTKFVLRHEFPAAAAADVDDWTRLSRSAPAHALGRLPARAASDEPVTFWEEERVVVFTHDLRQPQQPTNSVVQFMEDTGARVHIARIYDPFGRSLSNVYASATADTGALGESKLVVAAGLRLTQGSEEHPDDRLERRMPSLDALTLNRGLETRAKLHTVPFGRFSPRRDALAEDQETAAPLQFGWWVKPDPAARSVEPPPVRLAYTTTGSGLAERPLAFASVVGRGHLLFLAYSPFEGFSDALNWRGRPRTEKDVLGGMQLLEQIHAATEAQLADLGGPVVAVSSRVDGGLWITVTRDVQGSGPLQSLSFKDLSSNQSIPAPMIDFDFGRKLFTYAVPASALELMPRCATLELVTTGDEEKGDPIYACPSAVSQAARGRLDAISALELLARYTGGRVRAEEATEGDERSTRPLGLGVLAAMLLLAWGRRARRRLAGLRAHRKLRRIDQVAQRRYDPPEAVVAAAGDWNGRTSTWPRTGSFAGYRPIEPGDRPSAVVLQDLALRAQGGPEMLPRVIQRIEEASPAAVMLVNLGESMRIPGRNDGSKAIFAGRVALHLAAEVWKIHGEAAIHALAVQGEAEILAPVRLSPGPQELDELLRARLRQRPGAGATPWPAEVPECGALVYVSDFQLEDEHALLEWVTRLEGEGIRVGAVMVYSPLEFTMIEGGRLAGSGVWADRTDWDPDDVFDAFSRRRDVIERIFDAATTGGLVVAGVEFSQDDLEVAFESGRLLQILR